MITTIRYVQSKHAVLEERYMPNGSFEAPSDERGEYGPIDPETGAEYRALIRPDNSYSTDWEVGPAYPETTFISSGSDVSHDELETFLRDNDLWSTALQPVMLPRGFEEGEAAYQNAFQFRPPERAPYSLDSIEQSIRSKSLHAEGTIYHHGNVLEVGIDTNE